MDKLQCFDFILGTVDVALMERGSLETHNLNIFGMLNFKILAK